MPKIHNLNLIKRKPQTTQTESSYKMTHTLQKCQGHERQGKTWEWFQRLQTHDYGMTFHLWALQSQLPLSTSSCSLCSPSLLCQALPSLPVPQVLPLSPPRITNQPVGTSRKPVPTQLAIRKPMSSSQKNMLRSHIIKKGNATCPTGFNMLRWMQDLEGSNVPLVFINVCSVSGSI